MMIRFLHWKHIAVIIFTCAYLAPSSAPENVSVAVISSTSAEVSWTPPPLLSRNGIVTEYRVSVLELDTGSRRSQVAFASPLVVQSLHPHYTYHFSVSAHTVGTGPFSAIQVIRTPQDGTSLWYCHPP